LAFSGLRQNLARFAEADDLPGSRKSGPHHKHALATPLRWLARRFGPTDHDRRTSREIIGVVPEKVGLPRLAEVYLPMDELAPRMVFFAAAITLVSRPRPVEAGITGSHKRRTI